MSKTFEEAVAETLSRLHQQYEMEYGMHKRPIKTDKTLQAIVKKHEEEVVRSIWIARKQEVGLFGSAVFKDIQQFREFYDARKKELDAQLKKENHG